MYAHVQLSNMHTFRIHCTEIYYIFKICSCITKYAYLSLRLVTIYYLPKCSKYIDRQFNENLQALENKLVLYPTCSFISNSPSLKHFSRAHY